MDINEVNFIKLFEIDGVHNKVGRISFVSRNMYKVIWEGKEQEAVLKGSLSYLFQEPAEYPVVGDFVEVVQYDEDKVLITKILERRNKISRKVSGRKFDEQLLAANIDTVFICISLNENFNLSRIERYIFALSMDVEPVILLTKKDLIGNYQVFYDKVKAVYPNLKVECVAAKQGEYEQLLKYFTKGSTNVLVGSSGVGKSTLVNALSGKDIMHTSEINKRNDKGRHTTTYRQLLFLGDDLGYVIDTPGMRELSIWNSDGGDISFHDIQELAKHCKFRDCQHVSEKGCAVLEAIHNQQLSVERYQNYQKLVTEASYMEHQKTFASRNQRKQIIKNRCERKRKS